MAEFVQPVTAKTKALATAVLKSIIDEAKRLTAGDAGNSLSIVPKAAAEIEPVELKKKKPTLKRKKKPKPNGNIDLMRK